MASEMIPPPQEQQPLPQYPVNSDLISAVTPSTPQATIANNNGEASEQVFCEIEESSCFKYLDSQERADKFRRYESDFKQWLLAKHFSVSIYEEATTIIDGETIKSSKWPRTRLYADPDISFPEPVQSLDEEEEEDEDEEEEIVDSPTAETTHGETETPNGDIVSKKNSS